MGKLFESIKKEYEEVKTYSLYEQGNFMAAKTFPRAYKDFENAKRINVLLGEINGNCETYFGSRENFDKFLKDNRDLFLDTPLRLTYISKFDHVTRNLEDYEKILNAVENAVGEENTNKILEATQEKLLNPGTNADYVLKPYIENIKNDINTLFVDEDEQSINGMKESLDYIANDLIAKKSEGPWNDLIEDVSVGRTYAAKQGLKDFATEYGYDFEKINKAVDNGYKSIEILPVDKETVEYTKQFAFNDTMKITPEFKKQILELDKFVTEIGIPSHFNSGEEKTKHYSLYDYNKVSGEITTLIGDYNKENISDEEKKELITKLVAKQKELAVVEEKYEQVFDKIRNTFDLDKTSINGNLYTGRLHSYNPNDIGSFLPDLPPKWDGANSAEPVVLSGFCQLKGAALKAGVSLEEYIDNPVKIYLKDANKKADEISNKIYLDRGENNSLGKRIAHTVVMDEDPYREMGILEYDNRSIEFLTNLEPMNKDTLAKTIGTNAGLQYYKLFNRSTEKMLITNGEPSYNSIKNMFAYGDKVDKLYELSENYCDKDINIGAKIDYKNVVTVENKNFNPNNEANRMMETLKDYYAEREFMFDHPTQFCDTALTEKLLPCAMIIGAKKYYDDFISLNKKDIFSLDDKARKNVLSFMKDPVKAFVSKYKNTLHLTKQEIRELKDTYKEENDRINAPEFEKFNQLFAQNNRKENGYNVGKNISRIIGDNKGGWGEWLGRTTSKEYKALVSSVEAFNNPQSRTFGDRGNLRYFAEKYVDHKLPLGAKFEDLKPIEKKRVEFCLSIIETCKAMDREELEANKDIVKDNNIIDDKDFKDKLEKDVNYLNKSNVNENVIDTSNKNNIIDKEIEP
jgi:hypothetical protein